MRVKRDEMDRWDGNDRLPASHKPESPEIRFAPIPIDISAQLYDRHQQPAAEPIRKTVVTPPTITRQ